MPLVRYRPAEPEAAPSPALKPTPRRYVPLRLNRNFMNYPLARDARSVVAWSRGKRTGRRFAYLPGEDNIRLCVPADTATADQRAPTGFDMAVLFRLLAEAQDTKSARLKFSSFSTVLADLGLTARDNNRKRLANSLRYWTQLSITFLNCWYLVASRSTKTGRQPPAHITRHFPPPVEELRYRGNRVAVTLDPDWVAVALEKRFKQLVPLPLPLNATEQNTALMVLTTGTIKHKAEDYEYLRPTGASKFARKIGLGRKNRRPRLETALSGVARWFEEAGGELDATFGPTGMVPAGKILFGRAMPVPPWARNGVRKNRPEHSAKTDLNVAAKLPKTDPNVGPLKSTKRKELKEDTASAVLDRFAGWEKKGRKDRLGEIEKARQDSFWFRTYAEYARHGVARPADEEG